MTLTHKYAMFLEKALSYEHGITPLFSSNHGLISTYDSNHESILKKVNSEKNSIYFFAHGYDPSVTDTRIPRKGFLLGIFNDAKDELRVEIKHGGYFNTSVSIPGYSFKKIYENSLVPLSLTSYNTNICGTSKMKIWFIYCLFSEFKTMDTYDQIIFGNEGDEYVLQKSMINKLRYVELEGNIIPLIKTQKVYVETPITTNNDEIQYVLDTILNTSEKTTKQEIEKTEKTKHNCLAFTITICVLMFGISVMWNDDQ